MNEGQLRAIGADTEMDGSWPTFRDMLQQHFWPSLQCSGILEERVPEEIDNTFSLGMGAMRDNLVAFVNAARRQSVVETITSLALCNPCNLFLGLLSTILRIVSRDCDKARCESGGSTSLLFRCEVVMSLLENIF